MATTALLLLLLLVAASTADPAADQRAASLLAATPLLFHSASEQVYVARSPQFSVQVHGAGFALAQPDQADFLTVDLVGALAAQLAGEQRHGDAVVNYFRGSDASQWRTGVPVWERVRAANVYDGVDVVYYTSASGQLEFDFVLQPGADPSRIGMRFAAAWTLSVDAHDGSLTASHPDWGSLTLPRPVIYQPPSSAPIDGGYSLIDSNVVGFWLGDYDAALPLVIDPLVFSTYLGGSSLDIGNGVALDSAGNIFIGGWTQSGDFPTTPGAYDTSLSGDSDVIVSKFSASGALVYSTFIGGSDSDVGLAVAVDSAGNAIVAGYTQSSDYPTTSGAYATSYIGGSDDAFVSKFSASGGLVYSTYIGGSGSDTVNAITTDSAGRIIVTGSTQSSDYPTTSGAYATSYGGGSYDVFVSKFDGSGGLAYSTYVGGSASDLGYGVVVDSAGSIFVTGYTTSSNFPTTSGAHDTSYGGGDDAFVSKFDASGALVYSTYLGGSAQDYAQGVAIDSAGNVVVGGATQSSDFPTTPGAYATSPSGARDVFVAKFDGGGALVYSTYIGGSGEDSCNGIAVDRADNIAVTGYTTSGDYPTTTGAFDASLGGSDDAFVSKFSAGGALVYSTYLGGSSDDYGFDIATDSARNVVVVGFTTSSDFPKTPGAYDTTLNAGDIFMTKLFDCSQVNDCSAHGDCMAQDKCRCATGWASSDCSECPGLASQVSFASFHRRRQQRQQS